MAVAILAMIVASTPASAQYFGRNKVKQLPLHGWMFAFNLLPGW